MTTLKQGSRGAEVKILQGRLNLIPDGIFGSITAEAVIAFQKANHLTPDGIVGPQTWKVLVDQSYGVTPCGRTIDKIIVHCSATPQGEDFTVAQIRASHLQRGFSDIGYHYVVYRNGDILTGRAESRVGAHTTGQNANSIGVCYIGGCPPRSVKNWNQQGRDTRTPQQKLALVKILTQLRKKYPGAKIYGHRDFAAKACPSFDARSEYRSL